MIEQEEIMNGKNTLSAFSAAPTSHFLHDTACRKTAAVLQFLILASVPPS
jgi:hypothetical protein